MAGVDALLGELEPIEGVSLAAFVTVSLELARVQFDATRSREVAEELGIPGDAWERAAAGWSRRLRSSAAVAAEFARMYQRGGGAR
jgi:hypothetical protein